MESTLGFGMVRQQTASLSPALLGELCEHLHRDLGLAVTPYLAASYGDLARAFAQGELAFGWMPPLVLLDLEERGVARPLALPVRRGSTSFSSALVVRRHGPRSLEELQGYRVGWVDKESAAGYQVPRLHLAAQGIDVGRFFGGEVFLGTHFAVVDAVVSGRVDVGATFCTLEAESGRVLTAGWTDAEGTAIRAVEVLTTMGPVPNDCIAAAPRLPPEMHARLGAWLAEPQGRLKDVLFELFHAQRFVTAQESHYAPLRSLRAAAR